jgi:YD repeat-containing protein
MKPRLRFISIPLFWLISMSLIAQDIPVDPLTGKARIGIPIWNLTSGGISVPISAAYNGGGVRVGESEGSAGMSWNLQAGGYVMREVRGLPDDYNISSDLRKGWLHGSAQSVNAFAPTQDEGCTDWGNFNPLTSINVDTEPDVFHFAAPGVQGQFVFDNNGTLRLIPYQDIKITYTTNNVNAIKDVQITTNKGVKYLFSIQENITREAIAYQGPGNHFLRDYNYYSQSITFGNRWLLTSITGPIGESVSFQYSDPIYSQSRDYIRKVSTAYTGIDSVYFFDHQSEHRTLSTISAQGYIAAFTWSSSGELISSINIMNGSTAQIKNFVFSYETIRNPAEPLGVNKEGSRNYLVSIKEENSCQALPAYKFEYYNATDLPYIRNYPADFFGYFNNQVASVFTALIPAVYTNSAAPVGERFSIYPKAGYTTVYATTQRNVNASTVHYGSLKKVTYPSGGFAEITYQPNDYYDQTTNSTLFGGGVRVGSVKISDGDTDTSNDIIRNYEYKQASGQSSGRWMYGPSFAFFDGSAIVLSPDNLSTADYIMYDRAAVILPGKGRTVYEYLIPGRYPQTSISDWNATKTRIVKQANPTCPGSGNLLVDYYSYPFAPNMNYDFEQGLLSKEQVLHENGQLILEKAYSYQRLSSPLLIKGLTYEKTNGFTGYVYGAYSLMTQVDKTIQTETVTSKDLNLASVSGVSSTNYTFNSNQMLSEISRTNSDGTIFKDQFKYVKDFAVTTPSGLQATILKELNATNRHGIVVERLRLANTTVVEAGLTLFDNFGSSNYYPAYQYSYRGTGAFAPASLVGNPQVFTYENTKYVQELSIEQFNSIGLPVTSIGRNKKPTSVLYGFDKSLPMLQAVGAKANQLLFSDFENTEPYQLATANITTDSWTGEKSYQLTTAVTLAQNNISKATDRYYRFSCRAKATTASAIAISIKFSNGSGGWITNTVVYPASATGTWKLLEARIDMNSVPAVYNIQIITDQTILLDDVLLHPEQADVQSFAYKPLVGKTSETNSKGQSMFYEYDNLARLITTRDQDKQILEAHDYRYQSATVPSPQSGFTSSIAQIVSGQTVTFTAFSNCMSPLTYVWRVNGVVQASTSSTMNYTFATNRDYDVQLTVSHPQYGSTSTTAHYDVPPAPLLASLSVDIATPINGCWQDWERTFTVSSITGCLDAADVTYDWYFSNSAIGGKVGTTTTPQFTFNFLTQWSAQNYLMYCVIRSTCGTGAYKEVSTGTTNQLAITYTPCN